MNDDISGGVELQCINLFIVASNPSYYVLILLFVLQEGRPEERNASDASALAA